MKLIIKKATPILIRIGAVILIILFYRCPFRLIFDMNCPGCGMTRACLSALRLDFQAAFEYHPLFWLFGIEFVYALFADYARKIIPIHHKVECGVFLASLILLLIVWLFRQL